MTEKTVILPSLAFTYKGRFSLRAIEDAIKKYMSVHTQYGLADISYDISVHPTSKSQTITYLFTLQPHVQEECRLRISVSAEQAVVVVDKQASGVHELYEGLLKVNFRASTYSNSDEHKKTKKISYVLFALFRKLIYDQGHSEIGVEMKKYCYDLYDLIYGMVNLGKPPEGVHA